MCGNNLCGKPETWEKSYAHATARFCRGSPSVLKMQMKTEFQGRGAYQRSGILSIKSLRLWCSSQWQDGHTIMTLRHPVSSYSDSARSGRRRTSFTWCTVATGRSSVGDVLFSHGRRSGVKIAGRLCSHSWHRHGRVVRIFRLNRFHSLDV